MFTGVDFADFLLGTPYQTFYDVVQQDNDGKTKHYHFFAQDQWRASQKLTLTYGVRYEYHPGYYDPNGDIGNFDPSVAKSERINLSRMASRACWHRRSWRARMPVRTVWTERAGVCDGERCAVHARALEQ